MGWSILSEHGASFHVSVPTKDEDGGERADVHFMVDPGDGLCSTLVKDLPLDVAQLFAAAPSLEEAAHAAAAFLGRAAHLGACPGLKPGAGCSCGLASARRAVVEAREKMRERPDEESQITGVT